MPATKTATRRFRVEMLEERVAPACLFWDGPTDQMAAEPAAASMSNGLDSVRDSGFASPIWRGLQGTVMAHLGGTRSNRANDYKAPLAPQQVTELLDDIDRHFNQPLPANPLELLEQIDRAYNQPLPQSPQSAPQSPQALLEEIDREFNQRAGSSTPPHDTRLG